MSDGVGPKPGAPNETKAEPTEWPRLAATVIVARTTDSGPPQILLQRRAKKSAFMGGAYVFPGGSVDAGDVALATYLDDPSIAEQVNAMPGRTLGRDEQKAVVVAALRETLEEAGILLAKNTTGAWPSREQTLALQKNGALSDFLRQGWQWSSGDLSYWSHWVTPSAEKRRFDTHFFVAFVPKNYKARADGFEVENEVWLSAETALAEHEAGRIYLPPPTEITLRDLGGSDVAELKKRSQGRRIEALMPRLEVGQDILRVVMPWCPTYTNLDGEGWVAEAPAPGLPNAISFAGA